MSNTIDQTSSLIPKVLGEFTVKRGDGPLVKLPNVKRFDMQPAEEAGFQALTVSCNRFSAAMLAELLGGVGIDDIPRSEPAVMAKENFGYAMVSDGFVHLGGLVPVEGTVKIQEVDASRIKYLDNLPAVQVEGIGHGTMVYIERLEYQKPAGIHVIPYSMNNAPWEFQGLVQNIANQKRIRIQAVGAFLAPGTVFAMPFHTEYRAPADLTLCFTVTDHNLTLHFEE